MAHGDKRERERESSSAGSLSGNSSENSGLNLGSNLSENLGKNLQRNSSLNSPNSNLNSALNSLSNSQNLASNANKFATPNLNPNFTQNSNSNLNLNSNEKLSPNLNKNSNSNLSENLGENSQRNSLSNSQNLTSNANKFATPNLNPNSAQNSLDFSSQNEAQNDKFSANLASNSSENPPLILQHIFDSNLITNENTNTLITRLKSTIQGYTKNVDLCIISGFYNAKAFEEIARFKDKINSITLILGKSEQSLKDDSQISFELNDNELTINAQLDEISATKIAYNFISNHNIKIYSSTSQTLIHSKLYYIYDSKNADITAKAIVGSSNFTASGLGLYKDKSNKELNLLCDSQKDTKQCKNYFDRLLQNECEDIKEKVQNALKTSYFYHSPNDVLSKILSCFKQDTQPLTKDEQKDLKKGAKAFGLYDFQEKGAGEILRRLKAYKIAILADPVGSGKTLTALGVATMYKRVAIITPPKLKAQWESYKESDNKFILEQNFKFYSYDDATNKDKDIMFLENADLVIIDESHHFRNYNKRYEKLKNRLGSDSHILLLSATPINNGYADLGYQLNLLKNELIIGGKSYHPIKICDEANKKAREDTEANREIILQSEYYQLTNLIFSRSAIEVEKFLKKLNKTLPKQDIKIKHLSSIPKDIDFSIEKLLDILGVNKNDGNSLKFCIYDPFKAEYLPLEIIDELAKKNLENFGFHSAPKGFLSMILIKALESSIDAFQSILDKIIAYHENFLADYESVLGDDFIDIIYGEDDDEFSYPARIDIIIKSGYVGFLKPKFKEDLKADLEKLQNIKNRLKNYNEKDFAKSDKFKYLCKYIKSIDIKNKIIVFTESIITANALVSSLKAEFKHLNIQSITGKSTDKKHSATGKDFVKIKNLFSPKSLKYELKENEREIDILVATDCLSEGQNLQDCANLLNWDIAFNPIRAIQRIGRIWRIGSEHSINEITHFFPEMSLEDYIDLESKLRYKLDAANTATILGDPFAKRQDEDYERHKKLRQKQLEKMENTMIAVEESDLKSNSLQSFQAAIEKLNLQDLAQKSSFKDGIFSIAKSKDLDSNLLFAALCDISDKDEITQQNFYLCRFDLNKNDLLKSVSEADKVENLNYIVQLSSKEKPQSEFDKLEKLTSDYTDLSALKSVFSSLTTQLNDMIEDFLFTQESSKTSDGGCVFADERKFKLIAWLLINPNFDSLKDMK